MKPALTLHGADRSGSARRCASALMLLAITSLLNACGGGAGEQETGGGVLPATCITGPAPTVLTWDPVTGATGYRIYYDTAAGMGTNPLFVDVPGGSTTTTTMATGLSNGTTYYFAASALNGSVESDFSNVVCKTIIP